MSEDSRSDSTSNAIKYGDVIHLQSGNDGWGYLETRGWVDDKPVITHFHDPRVLSFVFTHTSNNRSMGSGSWRVLSAQGKPNGDIVLIGDKIHLENLLSGAGYLDTFEWISNLDPFKTYQEMDNGVFTSKEKQRGGGPTGTWIVKSDNQERGTPLYNSNSIYLKNGFDGAGFLYAYGAGLVSDHPMFSDFIGEQKFVFASRKQDVAHGSRTWQVFRVPTPKISYYVWAEIENAWRDLGTFEMNGRSIGPIISLTLSSADEGITLFGKIATNQETTVDIKAEHPPAQGEGAYKNDFLVSKQQEGAWENVGTWHFGGRDDRRIVSINVISTDNGRTITGTITYGGETPMPFKGVQATSFLESADQKETLLFSFFQPSLWQSRIERVSHALETAVIELDNILGTLDGFCINKLAHLISESGGKSYTYLIKDFYVSQTLKQKNQQYSRQLGTLLHALGDEASVQERLKKEARGKTGLTDDAFNHLNEKLLNLLKSDALTLPITQPSLPAPKNAPESSVDVDFQLKQLLNIYTLWLTMNTFWNELSEKALDTITKLNQVKILPPVDQIRACFRQFVSDFEILQSCIRQRQWINTSQEGAHQNNQSTSLIVTDKLAAKSIAPFKHLITDSRHIIPLTFFSKRVYVRQMPYTDQFLFVGLTYDLTLPIQLSGKEKSEPTNKTPPFELMAIPHEIGHFMYRHANLEKDRQFDSFLDMSKAFENQPFFAWSEELFADLYGCLIAGPFAVLGMQALLATEEKAMVIEDDVEHPTGIFRPYFLTEMLRILHKLEPNRYNFSDVGMVLDRNWTAVLERWGYVPENIKEGRPARISLPTELQSHHVSYFDVHRAIRLVTPMIEQFAHGLLAHVHFQAWPNTETNGLSANIPWCKGNSANIYDYIEQMSQLTEYQLVTNPVPNDYLSTGPQMNTHLQKAMNSALGGRNEFIGTQLFNEVLAGWSDKGPHGTGVHD